MNRRSFLASLPLAAVAAKLPLDLKPLVKWERCELFIAPVTARYKMSGSARGTVFSDGWCPTHYEIHYIDARTGKPAGPWKGDKMWQGDFFAMVYY